MEIKSQRREEYVQARRNLGITKEVACLQQTPHGDFVVVYIEARDTSRILQDMMESNGPFDAWFKEAVLKDCHGMDSPAMVPPANEVFIDLL